MSQTRTHSAIEAVANVAVGYSVAVAAQLAVFPLFGIRVSLGDNLAIGALFTAVSLARSYALRRLFNAWTIRHRQDYGVILARVFGGVLLAGAIALAAAAWVATR